MLCVCTGCRPLVAPADVGATMLPRCWLGRTRGLWLDGDTGGGAWPLLGVTSSELCLASLGRQRAPSKSGINSTLPKGYVKILAGG